MNKIFRNVRLFSLAAIALLAGAGALLVPASAQAQQYLTYGNSTILNGTNGGSTTNVAATATNTYTTATVLSVPRSEHIGVGVRYDYLAAPVGVTPTVVFRLQQSLDNSNWETVPSYVLSANGGTNAGFTWVTNMTVKGTGYL